MTVYVNTGNDQEAISLFQKAIGLEPRLAEAHNNLGVIYNNLGQFREAVSSLQEAIKLDPRFTEAYYNLGNTYFNLKEYDKAALLYQKAIELEPKFTEAYGRLGSVYINLKKYSEAIPWLKKTVELDPEDAIAYYNLGLAYSGLARYREAINAFKNFLKYAPDDFKEDKERVEHKFIPLLEQKIKQRSQSQRPVGASSPVEPEKMNVNKVEPVWAAEAPQRIKKVQQGLAGAARSIDTVEISAEAFIKLIEHQIAANDTRGLGATIKTVVTADYNQPGFAERILRNIPLAAALVSLALPLEEIVIALKQERLRQKDLEKFVRKLVAEMQRLQPTPQTKESPKPKPLKSPDQDEALKKIKNRTVPKVPKNRTVPKDASSSGLPRSAVIVMVEFSQALSGKRISDWDKLDIDSAQIQQAIASLGNPADIKEQLKAKGVVFVRAPPVWNSTAANYIDNKGIIYIILPNSASVEEIAHEINAVLNPELSHNDNNPEPVVLQIKTFGKTGGTTWGVQLHRYWRLLISLGSIQ